MATPEDVDVSRRTELAAERTLLAWWRTGFTAFAVALGVGNVVPALTDSERLPYAIVGAGFAAMGVASIAYGLRRYGRGSEPGLRWFAGAGVALGAALLVLLVVD